MALLDIQRRMAEVGRIRIGVKDGNRPKKIETFRITSQSKDIIDAVAAMYGGEVRAWKPDPKGPGQFEVITEASTLDIVVAPGQVLTAWYELWSGGGCQRRCDGQTEMLSDSACICPADQEERRTLAAKGAACKPTTRLSMMLRDVPAIGLFRLETHGYYAAVELSGVAEILEHATSRGMFIPARLRLDQRTSKRMVDGKPMTMRYAVPMIEIAASFAQVSEALGMGSPMSLQSGAAPVPVPALPVGGESVEGGSVSPTRPALPAAPRGRAKREPLPPDRPGLPADPSFRPDGFSEPVDAEIVDMPKPTLTVVPPPPAEQFDALPAEQKRTDRGPQIAMSAKNAGLDDEIRHELIGYVTLGRTQSGSDCSDAEAGELYKLFSEIKRGRKVLSYDEAGGLVVS